MFLLVLQLLLVTLSVAVGMGRFATVNGKGNYFPGAAIIVCIFLLLFVTDLLCVKG